MRAVKVVIIGLLVVISTLLVLSPAAEVVSPTALDINLAAEYPLKYSGNMMVLPKYQVDTGRSIEETSFINTMRKHLCLNMFRIFICSSIIVIVYCIIGTLIFLATSYHIIYNIIVWCKKRWIIRSERLKRRGFECVICRDDEDGDILLPIELAPCNVHWFHVTCLQNWLIRNPSCPLCRRRSP